jgi:pseudouridylate synthase / pseudouridine kinase
LTYNIQSTKAPSIIVYGSVAVDVACDYSPGEENTSSRSDTSPHLHTSNPAVIAQSIGGVGHNVALAAHLVSGGQDVQLRSLVGNDL